MHEEFGRALPSLIGESANNNVRASGNGTESIHATEGGGYV
jgi:hypothetical protein